MKIVFWIISAYLAGAIPSGFIIAKLLKGVDIRKHGSCNTGATNVFRVVGPAAGIFTLILDFSKGFVPTMLALKQYGQDNIVFCIIIGLCTLIGHMFTVFLKFRGGKGVATSAGVFAAILPVPTFFALLVFISIFAVTRYVSTSSISAAIALPVLAWIRNEPQAICIFSTIAGIIIIIKHRTNIKRLMSGKELKVTGKNKENPA